MAKDDVYDPIYALDRKAQYAIDLPMYSSTHSGHLTGNWEIGQDWARIGVFAGTLAVENGSLSACPTMQRYLLYNLQITPKHLGISPQNSDISLVTDTGDTSPRLGISLGTEPFSDWQTPRVFRRRGVSEGTLYCSWSRGASLARPACRRPRNLA